jgi:hypothetical protein
MKKSDVYEIAIKILGLFMLTHLIDQSYSFIEVYRNIAELFSNEGPDYFGTTKLHVLLDSQNLLATIILVWLFIFKTRWLTRRLCKPADFTEDVKLFAEKRVIYEISMRITGLLMIAWTLPDFSLKIKSLISRANSRFEEGYNFDFLWKYGIQILLGCILILAANAIASFLSGKKLEESEAGTKVL